MSDFQHSSSAWRASLRWRLSLCTALVAGGMLAASCEGADGQIVEPEDLPPLDLLEGCQPLLTDVDCTLPYPSDFFRKPVDSGGFEVLLEGEGRIFTSEGFSASITDWKRPDGFSALPTVTFVLGDEVKRGGLVSISGDPAGSLAPTHGTVILNPETGEAVAHFVDFDGRTDAGPRQAIQLRPIAPLEWNTRYVVAVQGLANPAGDIVPAAEGFRRLREGRAGADPDLASHAARYDADIFAPLTTFGIERSSLQLAWDFTTGDEDFATRDMFRMRELVLAELESRPPVVNVTAVLENPPGEPQIWRTIYGTITGPMVTEDDQAGASLARDDEGRVRLAGTATFDFTAKVPHSVRDQYENGTTVLYGHGFFGSHDEVEISASQLLAQELGAMTIAIDWWGMSIDDLGIVVSSIGDARDAARTLQFTDRVPQAMANWLTLTRALKDQLYLEPEFQRPTEIDAIGVVEDPANPGVTNAGEPLYDPSVLRYIGISQGHILGSVMVSLNADLRRVVLNVGGAGFSQMMSRALPFERFLFFLGFSVPDALDQMKMASTMQRLFDRIDPYVFAPFIREREIPSGPSNAPEGRQVLQQMGLGDTAVPNFASFIHARTMNLPVIVPSLVEPYGLETATAPVASGVSIFGFGVDEEFYATAAPAEDESGVHTALRISPEAISQMRTFFETGEIIHPCVGPCDLPLR